MGGNADEFKEALGLGAEIKVIQADQVDDLMLKRLPDVRELFSEDIDRIIIFDDGDVGTMGGIKKLYSMANQNTDFLKKRAIFIVEVPKYAINLDIEFIKKITPENLESMQMEVKGMLDGVEKANPFNFIKTITAIQKNINNYEDGKVYLIENGQTTVWGEQLFVKRILNYNLITEELIFDKIDYLHI